MGIIDYIYFRFVALRKLRKAFENNTVQIRIKPDLQVVRAPGEKWIFDDVYKMTVKIGLKEYKASGDTLRDLIKGLINIARDE